ncbi:MAG: SDR family oxidoreductase [Treponema sp.]|jgi:NAD(P)-dependent dehydrogenase (short-subunit alcohol dehydrogenase family)|nr:SDR family oxidoreductase [Treponema sp.]
MGIIEKLRLDNKKAFVTGGARGIGYNIAIALAEAGADVALVDLDEGVAKESAEKIAASTGRRVIALKADAAQKADVDRMIDAILKEFGRIDAAFCNAGICKNIPAEEMTLEEWNQVVTINLTGVFLTAQAAGKVMIKQGGGSIINTASMSAHIVNVPQPQCSYNASKAGVVQLTKSLAVEWALKNVRVNSISPGYIGTDLILNAPALKPLIEKWNAMAPLKRLGKPEELQAIAVYLAGDSSAFTTGSDFVIDGAFTCI